MRYKIGLFIFSWALLWGCSSYDSARKANESTEAPRSFKHAFTVDPLVTPPPHIQSVQLHRDGNKTAPPVIKLHGNQKLVLEFDDLETASKQFEISVSHREKNWEKSPLSPHDYLDGFYTTSLNGGQRSFTQNPAYFHYTYTFPNERFRVTKSGNYLLTVRDYDTNKVVFKVPFFVTEEAGKLSTRIDPLFAQRNDGRALAQPFSVYRYPQFVQQPQFDLDFAYVQNQFWGRAKSTDFFDTATPGEVHFHLSREQVFIKNYEFNRLDLRSFRPDGQQIIERRPGSTPPVIKLRRDVQQFSKKVARRSVAGLPKSNRNAQYGRVLFSLETRKTITPATNIYLMGDFNNWTVDEQYRMKYNQESRLWKGEAVIKQGIYAYKYVVLEKGGINDLFLDRGFTNTRQLYTTFIYYRDPQRRFDRLLNINQTYDR